MPAILPFLLCLQPEVSLTTIRQLSRIVPGLLAMTGRVTMLGISRWSGDGASYRTIQRFFATVLPWATLFWLFFRSHLFEPDDVYLLARTHRALGSPDLVYLHLLLLRERIDHQVDALQAE